VGIICCIYNHNFRLKSIGEVLSISSFFASPKTVIYSKKKKGEHASLQAALLSSLT